MIAKAFLTYRNMPDEFPEDIGFSLTDAKLLKLPGSYLIKPYIIPGMNGLKDVFVRRVITDELFITSYTYDELTEETRREIIEGAIAFLKGAK